MAIKNSSLSFLEKLKPELTLISQLERAIEKLSHIRKHTLLEGVSIAKFRTDPSKDLYGLKVGIVKIESVRYEKDKCCRIEK